MQTKVGTEILIGAGSCSVVDISSAPLQMELCDSTVKVQLDNYVPSKLV